MGFFDFISDAENFVTDTYHDAVDGLTDGVSAITGAATEAGSGFLSAAGTVNDGAVSSWKATSAEANAIGTSIEGTGMVIGDAFITGANSVATGAVIAEEGLVAAGRYASDYACDIAVGSALSAVFVALAADGQEEATSGALAVLAATQFAKKSALATGARAMAWLVAPPIYRIPGVSDVIDSEDELETVLTFLIVKACTANPQLVIGSAGQYLAGALIYGVTSLVCEGTLPGGYVAWRGVQAQLPSFNTPATPEAEAAVANAVNRIAAAPSYFQRFELQTGTPIGEGDAAANFVFASGDFNRGGRADLLCLKKTNTGSGTLEVHVLSAESGYQSFELQTATPIAESDAANFDFACGDFDGGGRADLFCLKKTNTGSGTLEVHVLSAASNYQSFVMQTGTPIGETDAAANFAFACSDRDGDGRSDVICLKKTSTGTGRLEVHALAAASNYQSFAVQTGTALGEGDAAANFDFACADTDGDGRFDVLCLKTTNTGTGTLEVHVLAGGGG